MPTGYTAAVADGEITDLRTFALQSARGMGALITMRDEPWDAPIPERLEPNTRYHDGALAVLRDRLSRLETMSDDECRAEIAREVAEAEKHRAEYLASKSAQRQRYVAMIAKVEAWETEAEGIRGFMLEQLRQSLDFDCGGNYVPEVPEPSEPREWRAAQRASITKEIGYHEERLAAEIARTGERNRWLKALRDSLPPVSAEAEPISP